GGMEPLAGIVPAIGHRRYLFGHGVFQLKQMAADVVGGPIEGGDAPGHAEQPQRKLVTFCLIAPDGVGTPGRDHARQDLRVAKRVGDAVGGDRVLEIASVTDQGPPGTRRVTQVSRQAGETRGGAGRGGGDGAGPPVGGRPWPGSAAGRPRRRRRARGAGVPRWWLRTRRPARRWWE